MSRLISTLDELTDETRGGGLAIGNFDAVHLGHVALIKQLVQIAGQLDRPALLFTFSPPPGAILYPDRPPIKPLTTLPRRAELCGELGAAGLLAYRTTREFLQLTAREFFQQIIVEGIGARGLVEGPNFYFGRGRGGDVRLLAALCQQSGILFHEMSLVGAHSQTVSSTRVRELVTLGQIDEANQLLWQPYRIEGEVVSGAQRGRLIGFPTANLGSVPVLLPALGVYAGRAIGVEPQPLPAAIHIGPNPTFGESEPKVEVHLPNWSGSLYGQRMQVELLTRIRGIEKFSSVEELKGQLAKDVQFTLSVTS